MNEMKIKSGLVFDKHSGALIGFTDLNRDIELLVADVDDDNAPQVKLAQHVFVFMIRSLFKPSLSLPVAHYFTSKLKCKSS